MKSLESSLESSVVLKMECSTCGRWTPESLKHCKYCHAVNEDWEQHGGFTSFVVSQKSVIENRERKIEEDLTDVEKDGIHR
jgi:RNA polymerase subunit RPABC4/transcription elongation factor Spt4